MPGKSGLFPQPDTVSTLVIFAHPAGCCWQETLSVMLMQGWICHFKTWVKRPLQLLIVHLYYSCVMYCTLYQSCDSHKHIKLEQLRSAIKCHSVPLGVPRWEEMSYRSRTRVQCSRRSVFWSYDPKSQSRGQSENLQLP